MTQAIERRAVNRRTEDIYRKAIEDIRDYAIFMMIRLLVRSSGIPRGSNKLSLTCSQTQSSLRRMAERFVFVSNVSIHMYV